VDEGGERAWGNSYRKVQTRSYYGADNKLRAQQGYSEQGGMYFTGERRSYFSEYRYDALGRRVLVRTRRDGLCNTSQSTVDCTSGIERFVWSGDNILWELRGPGASTETADRLEVESALGQEYGIVGYTHAGGVDRPLVAYKTAGGNAGAVVVPHMNWRGLFSRGTNPSGGTSTTPVEWPGFRTTANHSMGETQAITKNWMGSLLEGQRDAGGQMYMRNRYYDPATGQFTQTDPIGLGGGLNTYGFAAGDPVSYDDPYGLDADTAFFGAQNGAEARALWSQMRAEAQAATESGDVMKAVAGFVMLGIMDDIEQSPVMFEINANEYFDPWEDHTGGGEEVCSGSFCQIFIDTEPHGQYSNVRLTVKLAHEVMGSLMSLRGIDHHSDFGAVAGENIARTINGCARRESHTSAVPAC
jgi:RHS repeat-associated protein